tara:strand:- start:4582 stop:5088 length:507 start_codon:yes stop_codon:yes gene_type:complete
MLEHLIKSKTRLKLLIKFFVNIGSTGYLNGLANEFGDSTNSIRKELNNLSLAGYLKKTISNNKVIYSANTNHPLYETLRKIIRQHLGIEEVLEAIVDNIGDVNEIYLMGDSARGIDSGFIEILIIGENINQNYLEEIEVKIEKLLNRKVIFSSSNYFSEKTGLLIYRA